MVLALSANYKKVHRMTPKIALKLRKSKVPDVHHMVAPKPQFLFCSRQWLSSQNIILKKFTSAEDIRH